MNREKCERKIAEYLAAIRMTYLEYNPDGKYLSISMMVSQNGNDDGTWDCWSTQCNNEFYEQDKDHPLNFAMHKDIKDEKYWNCVSEQDDRETWAVAAYEGRIIGSDDYFVSLNL